MLEDIATLTGGQMISEELGIKLENVQLKDLGKAKRIAIDKDNTTIVEGAGQQSQIQGRSSRSKHRSKKPPQTTTARNSKSGWQKSLVA